MDGGQQMADRVDRVDRGIEARLLEIKHLLTPHQIIGVQWMLERELDPSEATIRSGILADGKFNFPTIVVCSHLE